MLRTLIFAVIVAQNLIGATSENGLRKTTKSENSSFIRKDPENTLLYAAVVSRHGDRTAVTTYPNDPHKDFKWPRGFGELTNAGRQRLHKLGLYFQTRYHTLTGHVYDPPTVRMDASDVDRCLMSGQCFYSGYYMPPTGQDIWNDSIPWQPIPVHTKPDLEDNTIAMRKPCHHYDKLTASFYESNEQVKDMCKRYQDLYEYVGKNSGVDVLPCGSEETILKMDLIYDTLLVQSQFNLTLPSWTDKAFPQPLANMSGESFLLQLSDPKINRFKAGPLLKIILADMGNKITNSSDSPSPKLHLFSGHDSTVVSLLRALNIYNNISPPYGTATMLELWERSDDYYIQVLYKNETDTEPYLMNLPECPNPCPLNKFRKITYPLIPANWDAECHNRKPSNFDDLQGTKPITWKPTAGSPTILLTPFGLL